MSYFGLRKKLFYVAKFIYTEYFLRKSTQAKESELRIETIAELQEYLNKAKADKDAAIVANIFNHRMRSRFIKPALCIPVWERHGFLYTGIACQSIESYISMVKGLDTTKDVSAKCFRDFFEIHGDDLLNNLSEDHRIIVKNEFYVKVRCGLLHETETRGR